MAKMQAGAKSKNLPGQILAVMRFYSRLPFPILPFEKHPYAAPVFEDMASALPIAFLLIGIVPAAVLLLASICGFGSWLAAALSVTAMTLATGAFHEDGLADTMDGFGGGATPEKRLIIMKDSLIGSFGACALILSFVLRIGLLATILQRTDAISACAAILLIAVLSRVAGLVPLVFLEPARQDGASYSLGSPTRSGFRHVSAIALAIACGVSFAAGLPPVGFVLMLSGCILAALILTRQAFRLIGGQTGDVAGATQQVAEILGLLGLLAALPS